MKTSQIIIVSLLIASLIGCKNVSNGDVATKIEVPKTEAECTANGGNWGATGPGGFVFCDIKTTDSGKVCSDSVQCEGICLGPENSKEGARVKGKCSAYIVNFGNIIEVEKGRVVLLNVL